MVKFYNYNLERELLVLKDLVKKAGQEILKIYDNDFKVELKQDSSPVTEADLTSNNILISGLKDAFEYEVISEEEDFQISDENSRIWVIDPLDGTKDFVDKTDEFSIMVALIENKRPILSVVYVPVLKKLYFAIRGNGSYLEIDDRGPEKLKVSNISILSDFRLVKSRHHFREKDKEISKNLGIKNYIDCGSVGVKFGLIAEGDAEFCFYTTDKIKIWDCCAPELILTEAGGVVFTLDGTSPIYDLKSKKMMRGFIGTNGFNKEKILSAIHNIQQNIRREVGLITKDDRRKRNNHHSAVLWFTGLSGSGKSTLAKEVEKKLFNMGINVYVLDGDNLRFGLNKDLNFSVEDRQENIRRVAEVSRLFVDSGHFVLSAFISPYIKDREFARKIFDKGEFIEIHLNCPLEICEKRDVKGLYKKAREGKIKSFTGIHQPYENPINPELTIDTSLYSIEDSVNMIINYLKNNNLI